jgi:hypothetical protein
MSDLIPVLGRCAILIGGLLAILYFMHMLG